MGNLIKIPKNQTRSIKMISNKFSAVILAMLSVSTVLADAEKKGESFEYEKHPYDIH